VQELFANFDPTTVTNFNIQSPDGSITELTHLDDNWTVNGYSIEEVSLNKLLDAIDENEVGSVVANNAENHGRMGLSADSTWRLEIIESESKQSTILIGNTGPIFPSVFTRVLDQDEVVLISADLRGAVTQSLTEWRDKTIITTDTIALSSILLDYGNATYRLDRSDTTWTMDGEVVDAGAVIGITAELSNMEASGFLDEHQSPSTENKRRIVAMDESGNIMNQLVLTGQGLTRHVQNPNSEIIFEIPSWQFSRIVPDIFMLVQDEKE
tara:strand:+ start:12451 stop:13254 length:804 start_codon:yes stop_codon:yes gene_type:complete